MNEFTEYSQTEFLMGCELASNHIDSWLEYELLGDERVVDYLPENLSRELQMMDWKKGKADTVADAVIFQVQTDLAKFEPERQTLYGVTLILETINRERG